VVICGRRDDFGFEDFQGVLDHGISQKSFCDMVGGGGAGLPGAAAGSVAAAPCGFAFGLAAVAHEIDELQFRAEFLDQRAFENFKIPRAAQVMELFLERLGMSTSIWSALQA